MTKHSPIAAPSPLEREIEQIDDLMAALEKRRHWLRQASSVAGFRRRHPAHQAERFKQLEVRYCDLADEYQPEILMAAYRLLEIDAIHDALTECAPVVRCGKAVGA